MAQTARVDASIGGANSRRVQVPNKEPLSNTEHRNHQYKFPPTSSDFFSDTYIRENGSSSAVASQINQGILEELRDYIQGSEHHPSDNNNKGNFVPNKMATSNSSGTNQAATNANGFEISMNSSPSLANKTRPTSLGSAHLNSQLSSILGPGSSAANAAVSSRNLSQSNPNPTNIKLLPPNQPSASPQNKKCRQIEVLTLSTKQKRRSFQVVGVTRRAAKCTTNEKCTCKACETIIFHC